MESTKSKRVELENFIESNIRPLEPTDSYEVGGYIDGYVQIKKTLEENTLNKFISLLYIDEDRLDSDFSESVKGKKIAYQEVIEKFKEL